MKLYGIHLIRKLAEENVQRGSCIEVHVKKELSEGGSLRGYTVLESGI
jgi:hypothetical protein